MATLHRVAQDLVEVQRFSPLSDLESWESGQRDGICPGLSALVLAEDLGAESGLFGDIGGRTERTEGCGPCRWCQILIQVEVSGFRNGEQREGNNSGSQTPLIPESGRLGLGMERPQGTK